MPELPEVEVILSQLRNNILGSGIRLFRAERPDIVREGIHSTPWYSGSRISHIARKGKSIVFTCSKEGNQRFIVAELGMTGLFLFKNSTLGNPRHFHITLHLEHPQIPYLYYWNPRRFGRVYLLDRSQLDQFLQRRFGIDPFALAQENFCSLLGHSRGRVKPFLLNQHKIAGIGNIYANEILFQARIHPHALGNRLSKASQIRLYHAIQTVLQKAIAWGGSTIRDFQAPDGTPGRFQEHHAIYQKMGHPCPRGCKATIRRLITERSSFYCHHCQKRN